MNTTLKTLALMGLTLSLGACSTCMEDNPYNSAPYTMEGTAGSGQSIYQASCKKEPAPVVEETAPAVEPAVEPVQDAAPVFNAKQTK